MFFLHTHVSLYICTRRTKTTEKGQTRANGLTGQRRHSSYPFPGFAHFHVVVSVPHHAAAPTTHTPPLRGPFTCLRTDGFSLLMSPTAPPTCLTHYGRENHSGSTASDHYTHTSDSFYITCYAIDTVTTIAISPLPLYWSCDSSFGVLRWFVRSYLHRWYVSNHATCRRYPLPHSLPTFCCGLWLIPFLSPFTTEPRLPTCYTVPHIPYFTYPFHSPTLPLCLVPMPIPVYIH